MPKALLGLLLVVACLTLCGCQGLYWVWPTEEPMRSVPAEYPHLGNAKLAVVVRTLPSTDLEDHDLAEDLERMVTKSLSDHRFPGLTFVSQALIVDRRTHNHHATETQANAINTARKLGADQLLWLHVNYYALNNPLSMSFMQGRLTVNCQLIDCRTGERLWEKPDLNVLYPPRGTAVSATSPAQMRRRLLELFGVRLTDCFRKHKEPLDG